MDDDEGILPGVSLTAVQTGIPSGSGTKWFLDYAQVELKIHYLNV